MIIAGIEVEAAQSPSSTYDVVSVYEVVERPEPNDQRFAGTLLVRAGDGASWRAMMRAGEAALAELGETGQCVICGEARGSNEQITHGDFRDAPCPLKDFP